MKIRQGFVSNSSSSSFVVAKGLLTQEQISALVDKCMYPVGEYNDTWIVDEGEHYLRGSTAMNNGYGEGDGGLFDWFRYNDYPMSCFVWEHD